MKTKDIEHKKKLLKENYRQVEHEITFNEWLNLELKNDPGIGRWLTDNDDFEDFQLPDNVNDLFDISIREDFVNRLENRDQDLLDKVEELIKLEHTSQLYHAWYILPDGSHWIATEASSNTWPAIRASGLPVASLHSFQYSSGCDCDYCCYLRDNPDEDFDARDIDGIDELIDDICDRLQGTGRHRNTGTEIPEGYFNDEK